MAEGVGFEPTVRLPVRLISSQNAPTPGPKRVVLFSRGRGWLWPVSYLQMPCFGLLLVYSFSGSGSGRGIQFFRHIMSVVSLANRCQSFKSTVQALFCAVFHWAVARETAPRANPQAIGLDFISFVITLCQFVTSKYM